MTPITIGTNTLLFVDVPEDYHSFRIEHNQVWYYGSIGEVKNQDLPEGSWQIIGKGSEITEDLAGELVEYWTEDAEGQITHWSEFKNYIGKEWFSMAIDSLHSLIQSQGKEPEKVLVLKIKM